MSIRIKSDGVIVRDADDFYEEPDCQSESFKLRQTIANKLRDDSITPSYDTPPPITLRLSKFYMQCYSQLLELYQKSRDEMSNEEKVIFHIQAKLLHDKAIEFHEAYTADNPDVIIVPLHFAEMW